MGYFATHTIDSTKRIIIPEIFTERYGWKANDNVDLWDMGGAILMKRRRKSTQHKCVICGVPEQKLIIYFADVCGVCYGEIEL